MAGGRRWLAARQIELEEVPCLVKPENEAGVIVVDGLMQCRHMTRGAAVYLSLTMLKDFIESANSRRLGNLQKGGKSNEIPLIFSMSSNSTQEETVRELCQRWGIGKDTFYQARTVLELFRGEKCEELTKLFKSSEQKPPGIEGLRTLQKRFRDQFEPELFSGDKNLWNVRSAVGSMIATEDKQFPQMEFVFKNSLTKLSKFTNAASARRAVHAYINEISDDEQIERLFQLATILKEETQLRAKELSGGVGA